jgi:signal transduction protein with GAF and PtsI domain
MGLIKVPYSGKNLPMTNQERDDFSNKLRRLIETIDIANMLTSPIIDSIRKLLEVSAAAMGSVEASVLIRDGSDGDLRFLIAIGEVAEQLSDVRIPAGKGIAGFVLSSGQPMAVADAVGEETFYAEVDKQTGYTTQTLLATPLRYDGDVIGVLEYVNRQIGPPFEPFTPDEMDRAAIYADSIASLVNAYNAAKLFKQFSEKVFGSDSAFDMAEIRQWLNEIRESGDHHERMELAVMLREVAERGDAERKLCRELLDAIIRFSDAKNEGRFLSF